MWVAVSLFVLVVPPEAATPDLIVLGLVVAGGVFYTGMLVFNRRALEAAPHDDRANV